MSDCARGESTAAVSNLELVGFIGMFEHIAGAIRKWLQTHGEFQAQHLPMMDIIVSKEILPGDRKIFQSTPYSSEE